LDERKGKERMYMFPRLRMIRKAADTEGADDCRRPLLEVTESVADG